MFNKAIIFALFIICSLFLYKQHTKLELFEEEKDTKKPKVLKQTKKIYRSNRSRCFDCDKETLYNHPSQCIDCEKKPMPPIKKDNTVGRFLQR